MMATNEATRSELIQKTPEVCGGDARIRGRRIPVWQLVLSRRAGMPDPAIRESFDPPLTQAELDAAWVYALEFAEEVEEAIRDNEEG
jgi:uncharacterized protein (DUF433 family)